MSPKPIQVCLQSRHISNRGGLEKWTRRISDGFIRRGAEVHMLTSDSSFDQALRPFEHLHPLSTPVQFSHRKMLQFDRKCKLWQNQNKPDLTFGLDRTSSQTHIRAGNGVHRAYLERRYEYENYSAFKAALNPLNKTILKMEQKAFENPDLKVLFTNSYMVRNEILKYYNVSPDIIEVIHNGADWSGAEKDFNLWVECKPMIAKKLRLNPTYYHFLFVGNGYERKGLSILLKALAHIEREDIHLLVVGKDKNSEKFKQLSKVLGIEKNVSFFGSQADLTPFYQVADSLVIPSIYDPFANVTVEALTMGLFVVSSNRNGGHEVLKEESGVIIDDLKDIRSNAYALELALRHPKTWVRSQSIRNGIKHLNLNDQLESIIDISLEKL